MPDYTDQLTGTSDNPPDSAGATMIEKIIIHKLAEIFSHLNSYAGPGIACYSVQHHECVSIVFWLGST